MEGRNFFEWVDNPDMKKIYEDTEEMYKYISKVDDVDEFNIRMFALIDRWMEENNKTAKEAIEFLNALHRCSTDLYMMLEFYAEGGLWNTLM